jgi:hypothetical protein
VIGSAAVVEQAQVNAPQILVNRDESPLSKEDVRLADRQQLRRMFFDESRGRLR